MYRKYVIEKKSNMKVEMSAKSNCNKCEYVKLTEKTDL